MEIIVKPLFKTYYHINIHQEEIKAVHDLIKAKVSKVTITTSKYKFEDWDEFIKNTKSLKEITISSNNFEFNIQCKVEITEKTAQWDCSWGNYDTSASLFNSVDTILSRIEIKEKWIFSISVLVFFTMMLFAGIVFKYFIKSVPDLILNPLLITACCYQILYSVFKKTKNRVSLLYKEDDKNFWQRKKDDIIVNLGVAIVAFILGYFIKNH